MKSIFDKPVRTEVISRIDLLTGGHQPTWGKMTAAQMVKHCALCEEYYHGNIQVGRSFLGRIFGKAAIRSILKNEASNIKKNAPTSQQFIVNDAHLNLEEEKEKWKGLINAYETFGSNHFNHWFFGNMTKDQLGQFVYKHCDHHLKQFGV